MEGISERWSVKRSHRKTGKERRDRRVRSDRGGQRKKGPFRCVVAWDSGQRRPVWAGAQQARIGQGGCGSAGKIEWWRWWWVRGKAKFILVMLHSWREAASHLVGY